MPPDGDMVELAKTLADGRSKTLAAINKQWPIKLDLFISAHLNTMGSIRE
jgi:hypothetical protein